MKTNKKVAILLAFTLVLSIAFTSENADSQLPDVTIFIDPPSLIDEANTLTNFTININISFIEGLHSWSITLRYNPVLLYTNSSLIKEGPFLKTGRSTLWAPPRLEEDYIALGCLITSQDWADGSGTLANITFVPTRRGETTMRLSDTTLNDVDTIPIAHTSQNGYFRNIESSQIPTAKFGYVAQAYNVTFNASSSQSPTGTIQDFLWFWGGGSADPVEQTSTTSPVAYHLYLEKIPPEREKATVRLIVTDSNNITGNILTAMITFGIAVHDLSVASVEASPMNVIGNYSTTINVIVTNSGNQVENTTLTISHNTTFFDYQNVTATQWTTLHTEEINSLAGFEDATITHVWNTTGLTLGLYVIRAEISPVPEEANTTNNRLIGSMKIVTVLYSPLAVFSFNPADPYVNQHVILDASMSFDPDGMITSYNWDFGDSSTATTTESSTTHTYRKSGTFSVTLTVTDDNAISKASVQSITVHKLATATTLSTSSTTINVGSLVVLSGEINGVVSPVNVTVFQRIYGPRAWNPMAYLKTDEAGFFSYNWSPSSAGTSEFKAEWNGDDAHEESKSNIIMVTAKFNSTISLSADKATIQLGETATLGGSVNPAGYGAIATIEYRQISESWNLVAHVITDENGEYRFNWRPDSKGTYDLRAKWSGDDQAFGSESTTSTITVAESPSTPASYAVYAAGIIIALVALATILVWASRHK